MQLRIQALSRHPTNTGSNELYPAGREGRFFGFGNDNKRRRYLVSQLGIHSRLCLCPAAHSQSDVDIALQMIGADRAQDCVDNLVSCLGHMDPNGMRASEQPIYVFCHPKYFPIINPNALINCIAALKPTVPDRDLRFTARDKSVVQVHLKFTQRQCSFQTTLSVEADGNTERRATFLQLISNLCGCQEGILYGFLCDILQSLRRSGTFELCLAPRRNRSPCLGSRRVCLPSEVVPVVCSWQRLRMALAL